MIVAYHAACKRFIKRMKGELIIRSF